MVRVVKKDLLNAINLASRALKHSRDQIIIKSYGIHCLEIHSHQRTRHSSDFDYQGFIVNTPASVTDSSLDVDVSFALLRDSLKNCPENIVHIDFVDDRLQIRSGNSIFSLETISPRISPTDCVYNGTQFSIPAIAFKKLVDLTAYATDPTDYRASARGCYLRVDGKKISMIATETHQVAEMSCSLEYGSNFSGKLLLNAKILPIFVNIIDKKDYFGSVFFYFTDNLITLEYEGVKLSLSRFDYCFLEESLEKSLVFDDPVCEIVCRKDYLLGSLKSLLPLLKHDDCKKIELSFHDSEIHLSTKKSKFASAESTEVIPAKASNQDFTICFDGKFLSNCVKNLVNYGGDSCRMIFGDKLHPIHIVDPDLDGFKFVLCPLRDSD